MSEHRLEVADVFRAHEDDFLARWGHVLSRLTRNGSSRPLHEFTGGFYRDIAVRAPVAFAGYGITAPEYAYDDYATIDASGRIVLIFDHEPQEDSAPSVFNGTGQTLHAGRAANVLNARRHGALAVVIATEPSHPPPRLGQPVQGALACSGSAASDR
jgi:hypothetical protein